MEGVKHKSNSYGKTLFRACGTGFNHKNIAENLKTSPRTVETYLLRVKCKTGLSSKQDLAKFFHEALA